MKLYCLISVYFSPINTHMNVNQFSFSILKLTRNCHVVTAGYHHEVASFLLTEYVITALLTKSWKGNIFTHVCLPVILSTGGGPCVL